MSDEKTIVVGDAYIHASVKDAANERWSTVKIALELIKSSCAGQGSNHLLSAMENISEYADKIEAALKKE